jgi:cyanophycin synthetase
MLSVTPQLILSELEKRGIAARQVESRSPKVFLEFTDKSGKRRYINGAVADKSNAVACRIADDKLATAALAERIGVPTPATIVYETPVQAAGFLEQYHQIVVKPLDSAHGHGVTVGVDTADKLTEAIEHAQMFSDTVLLQQQVSGNDVRLLFIGGQLVAAAHRKPASVTGDGQHTVAELIDLTNAQPDRGEHYQKKYNVIPLAVAEAYLGERFTAIPNEDEEVQVIGTANVGSGGLAIDVTDELPAEAVAYGKKVIDELRMGVCGVDFIISSEAAYLIEINASPSFGMHAQPHEGQPRDVARAFVDWLLDDNAH